MIVAGERRYRGFTVIELVAVIAQGGGTTCTYTYRNDDDSVRRFTYSAATGDVTIVANP